MSVPSQRSLKRREEVLFKARNLRSAINRAKSDGNERLQAIWEQDLREHCAAYLITEAELNALP